MRALPDKIRWTFYLMACLHGQARYPFKSARAILRDQRRHVRRMIAYAYRQVPYYRETLDRLGLRPEDFRDADDLARLPVIEREHLQRDPLYFVSREKPLTDYVQFHSSGTSGRPVAVYHDAKDLLRSAALPVRLQTLLTRHVRRRFHYREARILAQISAGRMNIEFVQAHTLWPTNFPAHRIELSFDDRPEQQLQRLCEFRPEILCSYGSHLDLLFPTREATDPPPSWLPNVVVYGAEALPPEVRERLVQDYGIPVYSNYHSVEASRMGFECDAHRGLHINTDYYPIRIADAQGLTVPPGESGEVVVSNLSNRGTVLLNYRLGDVARWLNESCPCGRTLPLLSFLDDRTCDHIRLPSGERIRPRVATLFLVIVPGVRQYRLIQDAPAHIIAEVVVAPASDRAELRERISAGFADTLGPEMTVDILFVPEIRRSPGGKVRIFESRIG